MIRRIGGGVCAAEGFSAGAVFCGVKKNASPDKEDLMILVSDRPCTAAGVFTLNTVKAAPVRISKERIASGRARGIVANSGNANCCATNDMKNALAMTEAAAKAAGIPESEMLVCSTGVIGEELRISNILQGIPRAAAHLEHESAADHRIAARSRSLETNNDASDLASFGGKHSSIEQNSIVS